MALFFTSGASLRPFYKKVQTMGDFFGLQKRFVRFQAHDAAFDPEDLAEARRWHQSFSERIIPQGETSFARSSGPGGQHVNKTESKAITSWRVPQLLQVLPRLLHSEIRRSKYYSRRNDTISIQAQTHRSREANSEENRQKLYEELRSIYKATVPNASTPDKQVKYDALRKSFTESRMKAKKFQGSKKAHRKGGGYD